MQIIIPFKLLSYNEYYRNTRSGKRVKTGAGLAYDEELGLFLEDNSSELKSFGESLDLSNNILGLKIQVFNSDFFIQDKSRINKTSGDIDNYVKVLQDKLFKAMGLDDVFVKKLIVEEYPWDVDMAQIEINELRLSSHQAIPIYHP
jgi:Holliday junction resolvase RusA-like endonuclease